MQVTRVEQIHFKSDVVSTLCHASKNLYNSANYHCRQRFFENDKLYKETKEKGKPLYYSEMYPLMKDTLEYKALPAQSAQQVLKVLEKNWKAYAMAMKSWIKNPELFLGKPKIPKYKKKNGEHQLTFTNQQCKIVDGILKFPKVIELELKTRLIDVDLRQVRIIPQHNGYVCEIVYDKETTIADLDTSKVIGIDVGLENLTTVVNNFGKRPFVIKGGFVKAINQYYNKERARLQSIYDLSGFKFGSKLDIVTHKRNLRIIDAFHKISRTIVDYAIDNKVKTIIIGKNDNWKQEINIGKKNNQQFVQIPHAKLIQMIQYKAEDVGIDVILTEESYTSKCSFLDLEPMEHKEYVGKRVKRGLFRSAKGIILNADCNGAYNIIRKVIPNFEGIEGVGLHPKRLHLLNTFDN